MQYLTELAEKLVIAYQDQENTSQWISSHSSSHNHRALVEAMRHVLEQEVAKGCLNYDLLRCCQLRAAHAESEPVLAGFSE